MQFGLNALRFEDIRNSIISYLSENSEYGNVFDFKGSNMANIINVMSYVSMLNSYQLSAVANNMFLDSTEIRKNAVSIAKTIGYKPSRPKSAMFTGKFTYTGQNFDENCKITIKEYSKFISNNGKIFINMEPIIFRYVGDPTYLEADYILYQGEIKTFSAFGTGKPLQNFVISSKNIDETYLKLYVHPNTRDRTPTDEWLGVKSFSEVIKQNIFFIEEDLVNEGCPKIIFGDGVMGSIPSNSDVISVEYLETLGAAGNGEILETLPAISFFEASPSLLTKHTFKLDIINVDLGYKNKNKVSYAGTDLETLSQIQMYAPRFFSSVNRLVSKNDYLSFLNRNNTLQSVNVLGGEEYYDEFGNNHLGHIYITAVPLLPTNIYNAQKLYLTDVEENKVLYNLKDIAILSTQRHFFKPTYLLLDVLPKVELINTLPPSKQLETKNLASQYLDKFIDDNFRNVGIPYRSSKMLSSIDWMNEVRSSELEINNYFLINNDTFYKATNSDTANFLYLPMIAKEYDTDGIITKYESFVKTNLEVVDELLFKETGEVMSTIAEDNLPDAVNKRYNRMKTLDPSESTIYGKIYNSYIDRYLYSSDYADISLMEIYIKDQNLTQKAFSFVTNTNQYIDTHLVELEDGVYNFEFIDGSTKYFIATIRYNEDANTQSKLSLEFSTEVGDVNLLKFGIPNSDRFRPLTIEYDIKRDLYKVVLKMIGNNNFATMFVEGNSKLVSYNYKEIEESFKYKNPKTIKDNVLTFIDSDDPNITNIVYNYNGVNSIIGVIHRYFEPSSTNNFGGYFSTQSQLSEIIADLNNKYLGKYYIYVKNNENVEIANIEITGETILLEDQNVILFAKDTETQNNSLVSGFVVRKSTKDASAKYAANLMVQYNNGDIYKISAGPGKIPSTISVGEYILTEDVTIDDYIIFNKNSINNIQNKWDKINFRSDITLNPAHKLPRKLEDGNIYLITNTLIGTTFGGKLDFVVESNDLLIYKNDTDKWFNLGNIYNISNSLSGRVSAFENIPVWQEAGMIYEIIEGGSGANFNNSVDILWNPDNKNKEAYPGDLLVSTINGKFVVFDYSYSFNIDGSLQDSLPFKYSVGDAFTIVGDGPGNFANQLSETYYPATTAYNADKLIYSGGNNEWFKFNTRLEYELTSAVENQLPPIATHGDIIAISDQGNFENSLIIKEIDKNLHHNDKLAFFNYPDNTNKTGWYRLNELSVYPTENLITNGIINNGRKILNEIGFNSDFYWVYNPDIKYYEIYLKDIFDGAKVGNFSYVTGRLSFNAYLEGNYDYQTKTLDTDSITKIKNYFDNYDETTTFDQIKITPVYKYDSNGIKTGQYETDFDTLFNQYIVFIMQKPEDLVKGSV